MSFIIIDGYNLIGTTHGNLQAERNSLISLLAAYRKTKEHDITVVFDGWQSGSQREETAVIASVRVIYSRLGDKADLVIKRLIDRADKELIIITSDRDIMAHAWAHGCVPVPSHIFEPYLSRTNKDFAPEEDPDDEETAEQKRGNPRMPSRREKSLAKVLKKL
jgi:hypothetical protein